VKCPYRHVVVHLVVVARLGGDGVRQLPFQQRRELTLKANLEGDSTYNIFKRLVPGAFNMGFIGPTCTARPLSSTCPTAPPAPPPPPPVNQGLTLVHFSAQRKRFLWDMGLHLGGCRGM